MDDADNYGELSTIYQQVIGQVNGPTAEWLEVILEDYGFEWCKQAIIEAEMRGKRTKKYVEGILQNWKTSGGIKLAANRGRELPRDIDYASAKKSKYGW